MDFIEKEGAVSDELTSALLAISESGRPLRVKRAANSGEFRWRIRVKSTGADSRDPRNGGESTTMS
jgi:hypothetical protein